MLGKTKRQIGSVGEKEAIRYLRKCGYRILVRNYSTKRGEIDIVAEEKGVVVFVEVKSRRSRIYGEAAEAVDRRKRERIMRAANVYMRGYGERRPEHRFDIVAIKMKKDFKVEEIELIKSAF